MQGACLEFCKAVGQFNPAKGTTKVWILQYAYHRAINRRQYLTARRNHKQTNLENLEVRLPEMASTFGRILHHNGLKHQLRQGLATLSATPKQAIGLPHPTCRSISEITTIGHFRNLVLSWEPSRR